MSKHIRIALDAWNSSWNSIPELVLLSKCIKILVDAILWYLLCSYGYDYLSCATNTDILLKSYNLCDSSNYFLYNLIFSICLGIPIIFIATLYILTKKYRRGEVTEKSGLEFLFYLSWIIAIIITIPVSSYLFCVTYDHIACYSHLDFLFKTGNYHPSNNHRVSYTSVTIDDLCKGDYDYYGTINFIFIIQSIFIIITYGSILISAIAILLLIAISILSCISGITLCSIRLYSAFKTHIIRTQIRYQEDIAKLV